MTMAILAYLKNNLLRGFRTSPFRAPLTSLVPVLIYVCASVVIGFGAGLFSVQVTETPLLPVLPFTLFVFPSLLEEAFFRGILIPNGAAGRSRGRIAGYILLSTAAFVLWHPLNALTINPAAASLFLNPAFLLIVALLGLTCGISYVISRSLWTPILIHWLTVVIWVLFLGGRNKLLEL